MKNTSATPINVKLLGTVIFVVDGYHGNGHCRAMSEWAEALLHRLGHPDARLVFGQAVIPKAFAPSWMSDIFAPGSLSNAILYGDPHLFELDEADSKQDLTPQFQTDRFHAWVQIGDRVIDVNTGNSGKAFTQGHPIKVARVPKAPIYKEDPGLQARVLLSHPPSGGITDAKLDRMVDLYKQLQKNPGAMMIEVEEGKIKVNADGSFTQIA